MLQISRFQSSSRPFSLYRVGMPGCLLRLACLACFLGAVPALAQDGHRVALQGGDQLMILAADGSTEWKRNWGGIHDLHVLPNGNLMVQEGAAAVVEIDKDSKDVIWKYDSRSQNTTAKKGTNEKPIEVHTFQPLPNGRVMIAETTRKRIIEVDRDGKVHAEVPLQVDHPHPHTDTRLARKLDNGHYLVCHEGDGTVREYDAAGKVVWEYEVPMFGRQAAGGHGPEAFGNKVFSAVRLENGNTLMGTGNGHSVLEVQPDGEIVWSIQQNELPGIRLAWVTTVQVLENGNRVIGNCHAGPGQPILIEVDPKTKKVVWTLDRFKDLGNNVSNSVVLED